MYFINPSCRRIDISIRRVMGKYVPLNSKSLAKLWTQKTMARWDHLGSLYWNDEQTYHQTLILTLSLIIWKLVAIDFHCHTNNAEDFATCPKIDCQYKTKSMASLDVLYLTMLCCLCSVTVPFLYNVTFGVVFLRDSSVSEYMCLCIYNFIFFTLFLGFFFCFFV